MRSRIKLFFFFLILLTTVLAVGLVCLLLGIFPFAQPYHADGPVIALQLSLTGEGGLCSVLNEEMDEQEAADALRPLVEQASATGANTLLVEVTDSASGRAAYEDSRLEPLFEGFDPLQLLCRFAKEVKIQVFALADPGAPSPEESGAAALADQYTRLLRRYPIAGLLLHCTVQDVSSLTVLGQEIGRPPRGRVLGLLVDNSLSPDAALTASGCSLLLVQTDDADLLSCWRTACPDVSVLPAAGDNPDTAVNLLRTLSFDGSLEGALLGDLAAATADPGRTGLMVSYFSQPIKAEGFSLPGSLTLSYPADGAMTTADSIVLLGLSDPTLPLSISADAVPLRSSAGAFAVEVPLEEGANELTLSQPGADSLTLTVTCKKPVPSTGSKGPEPDISLDETLAGRYIEVTSQLASTLTDPENDGAIAMTVRKGARAKILGTVETVRSGAIVPAYLLSSGDYLLCSNAQLLEEDAFVHFTAPTVTEEKNGALTITFSGGTPLCYDRLADGKLILDLYDTELDFDLALLENRFVLDADAQPIDEEGAGTRLTLTLSQEVPLWGYDLCCENGQTLLYLRGAPAASREPGRPLTGVTVLLDPGHGGTDSGALGIGGSAGITEKEVNLALALAVRARLEQLGATVEMTRTDDTALTLQQRWENAHQLRPDFFLALHHNSTALIRDTGEAKGLDAYYFEPGSADFASALLTAVSSATGRAAGDARWDYFYVTRMTMAPAVLFEFGYLVNPEEFESCIDSEMIRATADGVAEGLIRCLSAS